MRYYCLIFFSLKNNFYNHPIFLHNANNILTYYNNKYYHSLITTK